MTLLLLRGTHHEQESTVVWFYKHGSKSQPLCVQVPS